MGKQLSESGEAKKQKVNFNIDIQPSWKNIQDPVQYLNHNIHHIHAYIYIYIHHTTDEKNAVFYPGSQTRFREPEGWKVGFGEGL